MAAGSRWQQLDGENGPILGGGPTALRSKPEGQRPGGAGRGAERAGRALPLLQSEPQRWSLPWSGPRDSAAGAVLEPGHSHLVSCPRQPLAENSDFHRVLMKWPRQWPGVGLIKRRNEFCICRAGGGRPAPQGGKPGGLCGCHEHQDQAARPGSAPCRPSLGPRAGVPKAASILAPRPGPAQRPMVGGPSWEVVPVAPGRVKVRRKHGGVSLKLSQC